MTHPFQSKEAVQAAHELLAFTQYQFLNRQNRSQFICINLLDQYLGNFDPITLDWEPHELRKTVGRRLELMIHDRIYPYSTVESFLAHRDGHDEPNEVDPEVARLHRISIIEDILKELA